MPKKAMVDEVREVWRGWSREGIPAIPQLVPTHPWGPIHPPGRGKFNPALPPAGKRLSNGEARTRKWRSGD